MKDRVSYESQVLYVGPSETGTIGGSVISGLTPVQLNHITKIEHTLETKTEAPYAFGSLNPLGTVIPELVDLNLEFEYNLADAQNEKWLGFDLSDLSSSAISGMLSGIWDEQNFYIVTTQRGDAVTSQDTPEFLKQPGINVVGFGNGVIENYSIEASLEEIPMGRVSAIASNLTFASGASGIESPGIVSGCRDEGNIIIPAPEFDTLQVEALRPSHLSITFGSGSLPQGGYLFPTGEDLPDLSSCSLTKFSIDLQLPRRINQRLGSKHPLSKPIRYPAQVILSCTAVTKDIVSGNLLDIFCAHPQDVIISMENPHTEKGNMKIGLKGLSLDSQVPQHNLLEKEFIDLSFIAPLSSPTGDGPGFYISGVADISQETTYGLTAGQLLNNQRSTW